MISLVLFQASQAFGGQAVFSNQGDKIFLIPLEGFGKLIVIDAVSHESKNVSFGKTLAEAPIDSIAITPKGEVLISCLGALWKWKEGDKDVKNITAYEEGYNVTDISCTKGNSSAPEGTIFALGSEQDDPDQTLSALLPGKKRFASVFCRRNDPFSAPQTDASGRMFIASNCDLWEGNFSSEADDPEIDRAGTFSGCRIAPLSLMNTDIGNSGGMVVREIAPCGNLVFAITHGRHIGAVIQCNAPAKPLYTKENTDEHPDLAKSFEITKTALASAKILYDGSPCDGLCAHQIAPDKHRVFWRQDLEGDQAWMMIEGSGAPKKIGGEK